MDIRTAILNRKSIRGFKPDPVPRDILEKVLEIACRAPSTMNTQPWEFAVVSGDVLKTVARENVKMLRGGS